MSGFISVIIRVLFSLSFSPTLFISTCQIDSPAVNISILIEVILKGNSLKTKTDNNPSVTETESIELKTSISFSL